MNKSILGILSILIIIVSGSFDCLWAQPAPAVQSAAEFEANYPNPIWGFGWTSGTYKVLRTDRPFYGRVDVPVQLSLAANEYEGVQIVLRAHQGVHVNGIIVSDLVSDTGDHIGSDEINVFVVGYVNTRRPPDYEVEFGGWWPDPLLDFLLEFDIEANVYQPIFIDVHTRADQPAGLYRGIITITGDNVPSLEIPIEVNVWPFSVPVERHFPVAVSYSDSMLRTIYCNDDSDWDKFLFYVQGQADASVLDTPGCQRLANVRRACHNLILEHRLTPDFIYRGYPPRIEDVQRWVEAGVRAYNIIHIPRPDPGECEPNEGYPAQRRERILGILENSVAQLEEADLLQYAYIYAFDEVDENYYTAMRDICGEIKRLYPTIPIMTTALDYSFGLDSGLDSVVDIWVPMTGYYEAHQDAVIQARQRGRQVWWYIFCWPYHPYANWFIEYTAVEARLLMGFMPYKYDADGFLYYMLNLWETNWPHYDTGVKAIYMTPYPEPVNRGPLTNHEGKSWHDYNGDGMVFYPGPNGPLPTIRLKAIRDGLEDYEYLYALAQRVENYTQQNEWENDDWLERARAALAVDSQLVTSLSEYSTDTSLLLDCRQQIAELIIEYDSSTTR
ncbi:MAG: DUF4091 domain-containing protein [Sedimentisphaerales bacterium]|nr:DUF4091 domain-containing protein [Sedimentisphaerales bacterium]